MLNRHDLFMIKVAMSYDEWQEERRKQSNIRKALSKSKTRSARDRQVERLAGKQYTGGQVFRGGLIGAGVGTAGQVLGDAIEGGKKGLVRGVKNPRRLLSSAARGSLVGSIIPTLKRRADVAAAEGGWF